MVRTSSLYFLKARALRHTSALLRYNARSLRHWYERAQFTIHFIKEIKKTCSSSIVELYKHFGIFKNTREVLLRTSLVFLKIPTRLYNPTMHSARFYFFNTTHVHSYCSSHLIFCLERFPLLLPSWFSLTPLVSRLPGLKQCYVVISPGKGYYCVRFDR